MKNTMCLGVIILILFNSCESPLSELEINDPSLIRPDISLRRVRDNNNRLTTSIDVYFYDKNLNTVQLKNGSVHVNGHIMKVENLPIFGGPYYTINTSIVQVKLSTLYLFTIELSDGKKYEASITTQAEDLYELNIPSDHDKLKNLVVEWKSKDTHNDIQIDLTCDYQNNVESGQTFNSFFPDGTEINNGTFSIPSSCFTEEPGIYKASISVWSKSYGKIDAGFRENSVIHSQFEKQGECNIK